MHIACTQTHKTAIFDFYSVFCFFFLVFHFFTSTPVIHLWLREKKLYKYNCIRIIMDNFKLHDKSVLLLGYILFLFFFENHALNESIE